MQLVAFILIGVATYGKAASLVTSLPIIGGIVACGVFLLMIALLGLVGTVKHSQVLLFFVSYYSAEKLVKDYIPYRYNGIYFYSTWWSSSFSSLFNSALLVLALQWMMQHGYKESFVSIVLVFKSVYMQRQLALKGWDSSSNQTRKEVEDAFKCCGFLNSTLPSPDFDLCLKVIFIFKFVLFVSNGHNFYRITATTLQTVAQLVTLNLIPLSDTVSVFLEEWAFSSASLR